MRNIKGFIKFILKFAIIIAAAFGIYWAVFWFLWVYKDGPRAYDQSYQHALLLQYNALEDENRDNELIVFGASYVPFGIDEDTLSEKTGMQSQTLGVEASMGTRVFIEMIMETAKPGDVVVYVLGKSNGYYDEDYMTISAAFESDKEKMLWYWNNRPLSQKYYRETMIWRKLYALTAGNLVEEVRDGFSKKKQVYSLDSFDEKGNMTILREGCMLDTNVQPSEDLIYEEIDEMTLDYINELNDWCNKNGVTFVTTYSMMIDGIVKQDSEELKVYDEKVREYLNCPVLGTPEEYFMPVTDFYNHVYHLNSEGAKKYSTIMGENVLEYLKEK